MAFTQTPALLDAMRRINPLLQSGDFVRAQVELETLLAAHPDFVEGKRLLAGTKQALGDVAGAEALLRDALALDPNWPPTLTTLGELLLGSGRFDEAEALLQRAVAGEPGFPRAAFVLARWYNDRGRPADALAVAAPFCANGDADAELVTQHVAALAALGRAHEAVTGYQRIAQGAPDNPLALQAFAIACEAAQLPVDAERVAAHLIDRGYQTTAIYYTHAKSLIALADYASAETALRECLAREPRLVDAQTRMANLIWMRTGDIAESTRTLDAALARYGNDDALWAAKAVLLQSAGDARGAYACLERQVQHTQAAPALLIRAGMAALDFDAHAAQQLAERALARQPNDAIACGLLVAALLGSGDAQAALAHCVTLRERAPDDQYLIALQTTAWRLLGDSRYDELCNYRQLVQQYTLQPPPGWRDLSSFLADLKTSLDQLHNDDVHPLLFQSLRHGTETTQDLTRSSDPTIQALFRAFDAPVRTYLAHIGHGSDPLRARHRDTYRFNGAWSVRLRTAGFHNNHVHPRGWISSACYIDLPEVMADPSKQDGVLTFGEPGIKTTPLLPAQCFVRPKPGMLVLFPSYFWHGTVPFASDQRRLTLAFDVVPA